MGNGSGTARGNTRARFEQWAKNPACRANTLSAVRNVPMADVARRVGYRSAFGGTCQVNSVSEHLDVLPRTFCLVVPATQHLRIIE